MATEDDSARPDDEDQRRGGGEDADPVASPRRSGREDERK